MTVRALAPHVPPTWLPASLVPVWSALHGLQVLTYPPTRTGSPATRPRTATIRVSMHESAACRATLDLLLDAPTDDDMDTMDAWVSIPLELWLHEPETYRPAFASTYTNEERRNVPTWATEALDRSSLIRAESPYVDGPASPLGGRITYRRTWRWEPCPHVAGRAPTPMLTCPRCMDSYRQAVQAIIALDHITGGESGPLAAGHPWR